MIYISVSNNQARTLDADCDIIFWGQVISNKSARLTENYRDMNELSHSAEATQGPESCTAVSCESSHTISLPLYKSFFISQPFHSKRFQKSHDQLCI